MANVEEKDEFGTIPEKKERVNNLIKIQSELRAPKNQENKFGGYMYRSSEDILEAVKPLLVKYDCQLIVTDSIEFIGDRFYVKASATIDDHGHKTTVSAFAREPQSKKGMDESQITGAASSYARKYALNGLFLIDDVKDPDSTNDHGKGSSKPPEPPQQQIQGIKDINKFLEVWEGGKIYADKFVYYNKQKFEATPEQIELIKKSNKFKPDDQK